MKRIFCGICAWILFLGLSCVEGTLVLAGLQVVPDLTLSETVWGEEVQASLASNLIDRHVRNQLGHELGQVNDLVFKKDGLIAYVLLSQSGGRELIPIPFRSIRFDQHENGFIQTSENKTRLEGAPAIGKDQWSRLEDPTFEREVFNYYGERQIQKEKKLK